MAREVENWLQSYAEYTKESESPDSFHLWIALSVLASAVRRNLWINQGIYFLYPNQFVILVGPPGRVAKSTAIRMGRHLLQSLDNIHFGPDSVTREELIRLLAGTYDKKQSAMVIHSTELSSLIEPSGIKMVQFLTDIYDCDWNPKGWSHGTKHSGSSNIMQPVINLLAGTTPSWIAEGLPADATQHGFTSRTVFVYEDAPRFLNPRPKEPDPELTAKLKMDLAGIALLEGEFKFSQKGQERYDLYYAELEDTIPADFRLESFHWRKRAHVLKLAMLVSIAESDDLIIDDFHIEVAIDLLKQVEKNMPKVFSAVGKYEHASDLERILGQIRKRSEAGLDLSEILTNNYFAGKPEDLMNILRTLVLMKKVRVEGSRYVALNE
jgi:hypothetical protein